MNCVSSFHCDSLHKMRSILVFLIGLVGVVFVSGGDLGSIQSTAVKGKLLCDGKPANAVKVKLIETDLADPDDILSEGRTNKEGTFFLNGTETEIAKIGKF